MSKLCEHCGGGLDEWKDIAIAMEQTITSAPPGLKPMMRQAVDEIRELREKVRLQRDWPMVQMYHGIAIEDLYREATACRAGHHHKPPMVTPWNHDPGAVNFTDRGRYP